MKFSQMKMRQQLLAGFAISLAIFAVAVAAAYWLLVKAETTVDSLVSSRYPKVMMAQGIIKRVIDNGRGLRAAAMAETPQDAEPIIKKIEDKHKLVGDDIAKLDSLVFTERGHALVKGMADAKDKLTPMLSTAFELIRAGDRSKTAEYLKQVGAANNALWDAAEAFGKFQEEGMAKDAKDAESGLTTVQAMLLASTGIAIALSVVLALWLSGKISRRLEQAVAMADAIAQGRLDSRVQDDGADEIADLLKAMSQMQQGLSGMVLDIKGIVSAAEAGDLSRRMSLQGKQGFGKEIGESLNRLVDTVDTSLQDISRVAQALADGDLSRKIEADYAGAFGQTANAVNRTVDALNAVIGEVRTMVNAASEGDFGRHIDLAGKLGYAKALAELLNSLGATANQALSDISRVAQSLAQGDLTQRIDRQYPGLFGSTADAINAISANLQQLVGNIAEAVGAISTASKEIAAGNQDLSGRTEEQASSLEETASSMEELTSTVKQNAANSEHASELASNARHVAIKGGEVVGQVVDTMSAIHQSSSKIANIIGVIDSIAFQTNILALNAAVEAARAGEQGRGFAVVATEVRNLAQRSATAAKEIKDLIADSVAKVENGNQQVEQAGKTMAEVVGSIQQVAGIMADISAASREQSTGIQHIGLAIQQMDQVTQQNAALVEQAAAAAESLDEQTQGLASEVGKFKLATEVLTGSAPRLSRSVAPASLPPRTPRLLAQPKHGSTSIDDEWESF